MDFEKIEKMSVQQILSLPSTIVYEMSNEDVTKFSLLLDKLIEQQKKEKEYYELVQEGYKAFVEAIKAPIDF